MPARSFSRCCSVNSARSRKPLRTLATTCAAFLHHAFDPKTKRFHNHMSFDRRWLDEQGSEDCQGRALWALGHRRGAFALPQLPDDGRATIRAGAACR